MEFILAQQAQFASDIQAMKDVQAANQSNLGGLIDVVKGLAKLQENLATETSNRFAQFSSSIRETNEATNTSVRETNNRLNALIGIVERHIADHK